MLDQSGKENSLGSQSYRHWTTAGLIGAGVAVGILAFVFSRPTYSVRVQPFIVSLIDDPTIELRKVPVVLSNDSALDATIFGASRSCGIWLETPLPLTIAGHNKATIIVIVSPNQLKDCGHKLDLFSDSVLENSGKIFFELKSH